MNARRAIATVRGQLQVAVSARREMREGATQPDRDRATVDYTRAVDVIFEELQGLERGGVLSALDAIASALAGEARR